MLSSWPTTERDGKFYVFRNSATLSQLGWDRVRLPSAGDNVDKHSLHIRRPKPILSLKHETRCQKEKMDRL